MKSLDGQLGRTYLETYYPSVFDEDAFLKALKVLEENLLPDANNLFNISALAEQYGLSHETVENAAILHHLFSVTEKIARSSREPLNILLDVGGGPTVYQHIPFSLITRSIVHADLLEENQKEVKSFLDQKPEAYNWDAYFRIALRYLNDRSSLFPHLFQMLREQGIENIISWQSLVRRLIAGHVVSCDVFSPTMEIEGESGLSKALLDSSGQNAVNIVTSHFLLESATHDMATWRKGLNHVSSFLLPGGFLSMMAIRHAHWYRSGEDRVPAVSVDETILIQELKSAGFTVCHISFFEGSKKDDVGYDGMVFLLARKYVA